MCVIDPKLILLDLDAPNRDTALEKMAEALDQANRLNDKVGYLQAVHEREAEFSTAFEGGCRYSTWKNRLCKMQFSRFCKAQASEGCHRCAGTDCR